MSSPPSALRDELTGALGERAAYYWTTLNSFLVGDISRVEFEELVRQTIDTPHLVQLHNNLIISVLGSALHHTPLTPPPDGPGKPPRKRRRAGAADADGGEPVGVSPRLKAWTVGVGRRERERVKALEAASREARLGQGSGSRYALDEVALERGVRLLPEGKDPPGTYGPIHLASETRAPTLQHIAERVALISAQHDLQPPNKAVASLVLMACESKLKQLIAQALALTATSHSITSIQPTSMSSSPTSRVLTSSAFETLFTVRPAVLPNQSAAATRLLAEGSADTKHFFDHDVHFRERHTADPRWQILAVLAERSTVREALLAAR